jgi:hypothetical protein
MSTGTVSIKEAYAAFAAGLRHAASSESAWKAAWSRLAAIGPARIGRMTPLNQWTAMMQGAKQYTATAQGWNRLNRTVDEGAKPVFVLQPVMVPLRDERGQVVLNKVTGKPEKRLAYFRQLAQYRVEDTVDAATGERGYTPPPPPVDVAQSFEGWQHLIPQFESAFGVRIGFDTESLPEGVNGFFRFHDRAIVVRQAGRSSGAVFRTLCHELSHSLLHGEASHDERGVREVEAETSAAVVCRALGVVTDTYSFQYVACWGGLDADALDKQLKASATNILKATKAIMAIVAPDHSEE